MFRQNDKFLAGSNFNNNKKWIEKLSPGARTVSPTLAAAYRRQNRPRKLGASEQDEKAQRRSPTLGIYGRDGAGRFVNGSPHQLNQSI